MNRTRYPVLPLRDVVVYPHVIVPLFVGREQSIAALDHAMENSQELLLLPQRDPKTREPEIADLHDIGTVGRIVQMAKLSDGTVKVLMEGLHRVKVKNFSQEEGYMSAEAMILSERTATAHDELHAMMNSAVNDFSRYLKENDKSADELIETLRQIHDAGRLADTIAAHVDLRIEQRIGLLGLLDIQERLERVLVLLEEEHEKADLERSIKKRVKQQMERNQREYYLNEQMKAIQKELGDMDEAQNEVEQLEADILAAKMPADAEKKALSELNKLKQMSAMSAEANVIRNYLEWMIDYPWSRKKRSQYNLERAENILNRDHYGLEDVKERILEYFAVQKRSNR